MIAAAARVGHRELVGVADAVLDGEAAVVGSALRGADGGEGGADGWRSDVEVC